MPAQVIPIIVDDGISDIKNLPSSLAGAARRACEQALMEWTISGRVPLTILVVGPSWPADEVRFASPPFPPEPIRAKQELAAKIKQHLAKVSAGTVDGLVWTGEVYRGRVPKDDPHADELIALAQKQGVRAMPPEYRQECILLQISDGRHKCSHMIAREIIRQDGQTAILGKAELQSFSIGKGKGRFAFMPNCGCG